LRLLKLGANGFRSLANICLEFDHLTVLIGANDSGKSSVLDLLEILLSNRQPEDDDFRIEKGGSAIDCIEAVLEFTLQDEDTEAREFAIGNSLLVKRLYSRGGGAKTHYRTNRPKDERLLANIAALNAQDQRSLILEIDPSIDESDISNEEKRIRCFRKLKEAAEKTEDWVEAPSALVGLLPRFERYSAMDYNDPASVISKTLRQVYERTIYEGPESEGGISTKRLIKELREVEALARAAIEEKIAELQGYIQKYSDGVKGVSYRPAFDFVGSLRQGEFLLDRGYGLHPLSRIGDGTKRRMFMAVTDWDREVTLEQAKSGPNLPSVIRGYDEPDTNLHYDAQRLMFSAISDIVCTKEAGIQAILCTHSLTMIDRAPAQTIRLFSLDDDGRTQIEQLNTNDDPEIEQFLQNLARELGFTNSIMFYERCFVLVEGDTEANALPILYRRIHGRSILEDCIRVINVRGNSAIREFLRLLGRNRKDMVVVLVDKDSEERKDTHLTRRSLMEAGFDAAFISERFVFIGQKEFEDAFPNQAIARALQTKWPRNDGTEWRPDQIEVLRREDKFSNRLRKLVYEHAAESSNCWSKPEFGRVLAETCELEEVPEEISQLFMLARKITGMQR